MVKYSHEEELDLSLRMLPPPFASFGLADGLEPGSSRKYLHASQLTSARLTAISKGPLRFQVVAFVTDADA